MVSASPESAYGFENSLALTLPPLSVLILKLAPGSIYRRQLCSQLKKHEVKLAETAIDSLFIAEKPEKLIGGKAYDSDTGLRRETSGKYGY